MCKCPKCGHDIIDIYSSTRFITSPEDDDRTIGVSTYYYFYPPTVHGDLEKIPFVAMYVDDEDDRVDKNKVRLQCFNIEEKCFNIGSLHLKKQGEDWVVDTDEYTRFGRDYVKVLVDFFNANKEQILEVIEE